MLTQSDLPFKGSREYLTGADIYDWIAALIRAEGEPEKFSVSFRRLTGRQLQVAPFEEFAKDPRLTGDFSITRNGRQEKYGLLESETAAVKRIPFDEDGLVGDCDIQGKTIIAPLHPRPSTAIELAVAMTKRLHHRVFPEEKRKWLFVRLELQHLLKDEDVQGMKITMIHHVETKFSRSTIETRRGPVGSIYFSVLS